LLHRPLTEALAPLPFVEVIRKAVLSPCGLNDHVGEKPDVFGSSWPYVVTEHRRMLSLLIVCRLTNFLVSRQRMPARRRARSVPDRMSHNGDSRSLPDRRPRVPLVSVCEFDSRHPLHQSSKLRARQCSLRSRIRMALAVSCGARLVSIRLTVVVSSR